MQNSIFPVHARSCSDEPSATEQVSRSPSTRLSALPSPVAQLLPRPQLAPDSLVRSGSIVGTHGKASAFTPYRRRPFSAFSPYHRPLSTSLSKVPQTGTQRPQDPTLLFEKLKFSTEGVHGKAFDGIRLVNNIISHCQQMTVNEDYNPKKRMYSYVSLNLIKGAPVSHKNFWENLRDDHKKALDDAIQIAQTYGVVACSNKINKYNRLMGDEHLLGIYCKIFISVLNNNNKISMVNLAKINNLPYHYYIAKFKKNGDLRCCRSTNHFKNYLNKMPSDLKKWNDLMREKGKLNNIISGTEESSHQSCDTETPLL